MSTMRQLAETRHLTMKKLERAKNELKEKKTIQKQQLLNSSKELNNTLRPSFGPLGVLKKLKKSKKADSKVGVVKKKRSLSLVEGIIVGFKVAAGVTGILLKKKKKKKKK